MSGLGRFVLFGILLAVLAWSLSGCTGIANVAPSLPTPAYTSGASDFPSLTPFQPLADPAAEVSTVLIPSSVSMTPTAFPPTSISPSPLPETASTTPLPLLSRAQYILTVSMDYGAHTLAVSESIQYPNLSGDTLHELILAVESNRWPGCLKMGTITIDGQPPMISVLNGIRLQLTPTTAIAPGQQVSLSLQYALQLPAADTHQVFGYHDLQTNLVDWYPFIVPYASGEGWLLHQPANVGEHLVYDSVDFDVTLQVHRSDPDARGCCQRAGRSDCPRLALSPCQCPDFRPVCEPELSVQLAERWSGDGHELLFQIANNRRPGCPPAGREGDHDL